ncbi:hypothetical protein [Streptomyces thermoalcalitolerans]|uniref:Uncharacterized protein n=1 Tax=Streptomyces thermoalcalitolerans TaxID=65605 RepID=A0ABN1NBS0_9ACTN
MSTGNLAAHASTPPPEPFWQGLLMVMLSAVPSTAASSATSPSLSALCGCLPFPFAPWVWVLVVVMVVLLLRPGEAGWRFA